jgi:hypothetical protein
MFFVDVDWGSFIKNRSTVEELRQQFLPELEISIAYKVRKLNIDTINVYKIKLLRDQRVRPVNSVNKSKQLTPGSAHRGLRKASTGKLFKHMVNIK